MKPFSLTLAAGLLIGLIPATQAAPKASLLSPKSSTPIDVAGLKFELRLPEDRTTFQLGETIAVTLQFSKQGDQPKAQTLCLNTFHFSPPSWAVFGSFDVTPQQGTTNPLRDLPPETGFSYSGPGPGSPQVISTKPLEVTLVLNEYIRFDKPGTYQIRAKTNHVFAVEEGQPVPKQGSFFGGPEFVSSAPLTIKIVPADPKWQQEQVRAWRTYWSRQKPGDWEWTNPAGAQRPQNDLRFLNTRATARAIIDRLGQDEFPRSSGSEAYFWQSGLIGFSDRLWLIGAMTDAIKRPDYPVTQGLLDNLATLQGLYHVARPGAKTSAYQLTDAQEKAYLANCQTTLAAMSPKKGRARAMTVHSLLETAWSSRPQIARVMQPRMPRLIAMVPDIFTDLPPLPQEYLLDDRDDKYAPGEWRLVKSPRFVAPLLRAWKTIPHTEGWAMERGDLILRHLYELDPKVARPLILQEMMSPGPRVSFEVLSLLNDKYLPQLQNTWWQQIISNGPDQDMAALLIGRYATPTLKLKIQKEYQRRDRSNLLSYDVKRGLKRYLQRVGAL